MELIVSSPCPTTWEDLVGNDRVRYCGQCHLNVYNLTIMKPAEIEQLVHTTGGRLCGRLYVRPDRTATRRDCPTGRSKVVSRRIRQAAAAFAVVLFGLGCRSLERPSVSDWPRWAQEVAKWIDPAAFRRVPVAGGITCVPRTPIAPTSSPGTSGTTAGP